MKLDMEDRFKLLLSC